jgi:hypothetical protein
MLLVTTTSFQWTSYMVTKGLHNSAPSTLTVDSYCRTRHPPRIAAEAMELSDFTSNAPMNTTASDHRYDVNWALTSFRRRSRLRSSNKDLANESRPPVPSEQNTSAGYPKEKTRAPGSSFGRKS